MLNVLQRLMKLTSSFVKIHHRIATTLFTKPVSSDYSSDDLRYNVSAQYYFNIDNGVVFDGDIVIFIT